MEHDYLIEVIDHLKETGMEELEAITLVSQLLEQEAYDFVMINNLYSDIPFFYPLTKFYS